MTLNETIVTDCKVYCSVVVAIRDNQNTPLGPHVLISEISVCFLRIAILYTHTYKYVLIMSTFCLGKM